MENKDKLNELPKIVIATNDVNMDSSFTIVLENIEDVKEPVIGESYMTKKGDIVKCELGWCKGCYYKDKDCWYIVCTMACRQDEKSVKLVKQ